MTREMIAARCKSGLTQEGVAELMATTKSAVSRLESAGKHVPSLFYRDSSGLAYGFFQKRFTCQPQAQGI